MPAATLYILMQTLRLASPAQKFPVGQSLSRAQVILFRASSREPADVITASERPLSAQFPAMTTVGSEVKAMHSDVADNITKRRMERPPKWATS